MRRTSSSRYTSPSSLRCTWRAVRTGASPSLSITRGFVVVDVMHAPDCGQLQVLEPVMQYFPPSFGNQSLAPIRFADPIADLARRLRLATLGVDCVRQRRQSDTADWLPRLLQDDRICFGSAQHITDYPRTVLDTGMHRPCSGRPDVRIACILEQRLRVGNIIDFPRA